MARSEMSNRNVLGPFEELSHDMERVFDSLVGRRLGSILRSGPGGEKFVPTLDVSEHEDAFEVDVDLPGVRPEDVKVEWHDGQLIVSGKREAKSEEREKNYHRVERMSGSFYRAIGLPSDVDADQVDARYENCVLRITLPKSAKQQAKRIQIRTGGGPTPGNGA